jgi:hypothetical protein
MEEQSGREFASADPTAGAQDATFQERSLCAKIPLSPRRRLQHFQRPTPSHVSSITPRATHRGDEYVARRRRGRLKVVWRNPPRFLASQRDDADAGQEHRRSDACLLTRSRQADVGEGRVRREPSEKLRGSRRRPSWSEALYRLLLRASVLLRAMGSWLLWPRHPALPGRKGRPPTPSENLARVLASVRPMDASEPCPQLGGVFSA